MLSNTSYRFGPFELRGDERRLFSEGKPIRLRRKALDLLLAFVEEPRTVLTVNQLKKRVWGNTNLEEKYAVQGVVAELRRALGHHRKLIETIPARGYEFTGTVEPVLRAPDNQPSKLRDDFIAGMDKVSRLLPERASGIPWIIGNQALEIWEAKLKQLVECGLEMSRPLRRACHEELLKTTTSVTIVDSMIFDPQREWSGYWRDFLKKISQVEHIATREYYILATLPLNAEDAAKLLATEKLLRSVQFRLFICESAYLHDSLGSQEFQFDALNIFGEIILRVNILAASGRGKVRSFAGGENLLVRLHHINEPIYAEFYRAMRECAAECNPRSIASNRQQRPKGRIRAHRAQPLSSSKPYPRSLQTK